MKCSLCGCEFDENKVTRACENCIMRKGCGLYRCPQCGFEMPEEPKWIKKIKQFMCRKDK